MSPEIVAFEEMWLACGLPDERLQKMIDTLTKSGIQFCMIDGVPRITQQKDRHAMRLLSVLTAILRAAMAEHRFEQFAEQHKGFLHAIHNTFTALRTKVKSNPDLDWDYIKEEHIMKDLNSIAFINTDWDAITIVDTAIELIPPKDIICPRDWTAEIWDRYNKVMTTLIMADIFVTRKIKSRNLQ